MDTLMPPIQAHIIRHLDQASASALAHTCRHFASLCAQVRSATMSQHRHQTISHTVTGHSAPLSLSLSFTASSSSLASHSPRSIGADEDTDMTSPEEEWDFRMTPEIVMRLSLVAQVKGAALPLLPTELQIQIFGYLDKIDSVCFGLTCPRLYEIYRSIYGTKMPLNTRRVGPNSLESAWELVGKQECMQCGMFRCELWQHIKTWMPKELEYCSMKQNFGSHAKTNAKDHCYRSKPSKPRRCGRHPVRTSTIHQDDHKL